MGTMIFIRHGETVWNKAGKFQGQVDVPLSEIGLNQAQQVADYLITKCPISTIYSSDLQRASGTAQIIAKRFNLEVKHDQRLREFSFGVWEGLTRKEIEEKYYDLYLERQRNLHTRVPGGESAIELQRRVMEAIHDICQQQPQVVAVVSHGGTIRIALASILGLDLANAYRLMIANAALSIVHWKEDQAKPNFVVETINNSSYLS